MQKYEDERKEEGKKFFFVYFEEFTRDKECFNWVETMNQDRCSLKLDYKAPNFGTDIN